MSLIPALTIAVGVLHLAYVAANRVDRTALLALARDGVVGAADAGDDRRAAVWSLVFGVGVVSMGILAATSEASDVALGWCVLVIGALVTLAWPRSGGWLLLAIGVGALLG